VCVCFVCVCLVCVCVCVCVCVSYILLDGTYWCLSSLSPFFAPLPAR